MSNDLTKLKQLYEAEIANLKAQHDKRVTELLEYNNREVERRRKVRNATDRIILIAQDFMADGVRSFFLKQISQDESLMEALAR